VNDLDAPDGSLFTPNTGVGSSHGWPTARNGLAEELSGTEPAAAVRANSSSSSW